jgi:hypothetical protein
MSLDYIRFMIYDLHPFTSTITCLHVQGKVAVITGGDSGIGRAVARLFSLEGASVCICYVGGREDKDAEDTIKMINECKTPEAKEPLKIATDVGYAENCKMVRFFHIPLHLPVAREVVCRLQHFGAFSFNCAEWWVVSDY